MNRVEDLELLIDLHLRNDRQGPGGDDETRRAIDLARLDLRKPLAIADVGCGTGASALVLARTLRGRVRAIDASAAFIDRLEARAGRSGLGGRVSAEVGRMESLPFGEGELDLLWSEGAIYSMGFGAGVRAWRRYLRPGGVLAISELTWTTGNRPADISAYWLAEYPEVDTASAKIRTLEGAGYEPLGFFFLPGRCWEQNYYEPIRRGFVAFLGRHNHSDAARAVVESEVAEARFYREHGAWYGYGFYVARKRVDVDI